MLIIRTLIIFTLTLCQLVIAHPHSWVNLTSHFVINDKSELVEVRQRWIFDTFYSALTLDDLRKQFDSDEVGLKIQGDEIVGHLASVNYFSHLVVGGSEVSLFKPDDWMLSTFTVGDEEVLILEMSFPISPMSLVDETLKWSVYDPSYYVSMRHDSVDVVLISNSSTSECQPEVLESDPSDEDLFYASSLDKTQSASDGLGKVFAQTVILQCL